MLVFKTLCVILVSRRVWFPSSLILCSRYSEQFPVPHSTAFALVIESRESLNPFCTCPTCPSCKPMMIQLEIILYVYLHSYLYVYHLMTTTHSTLYLSDLSTYIFAPLNYYLLKVIGCLLYI